MTFVIMNIMRDDQSGKGDNTQQSSSVMGDQNKSDDKKTSGMDAAAASRKKRVDFERRMMFNSALSRGKSPEEAARYSGVKMGIGQTLKSTEIMDLKYHGTQPKKRKRL